MDISLRQENSETPLNENNYSHSIQALEEAIQSVPDELTNYWYLGLAYLSQGEEETAQLVWLSALAELQADGSDTVVQSLIQTLTSEAERLTSLEEYPKAWAVRHHLREFAPEDLTNLLLLVDLSIRLEEFNAEFLIELGVLELLSTDGTLVDLSILVTILERVLEVPADEVLSFAEACLPHFLDRQQWVDLVNTAASDMAFQRRLVLFAIALVKLCLKHEPDNAIALGYLPRFYTECQRFTEAVAEARNFYHRSSTPDTQFFSTCILLQSLMRAGDWKDIPTISSELGTIVSNFIKSQSTQLSLNTIRFLIIITGLFLYLKDDITGNRQLQNQAGKLFLKNIETNAPGAIKPLPKRTKSKTERLKIGYIANTFRVHSVGWLCRWLFQHHNREDFEIFIYHVNQRPGNEFFESWFANQVDTFRYLTHDVSQGVETIRNDEIDILVDLDSITLDQTCNIMALKPAPIQVTWLGYDASGLPSIDYYIADPYVLPDDAQKHYQEKIWRLPSTYIAVDGFEVGIPSIKRADLGIPEDAVVYWSSQAGFKRNPETIRLQMQILKQVPNSYFLIKGLGDQTIIHDFFVKTAEAENIEAERLKFLPLMADEYTHRANLHLADVVLDTYPYNGATTTLETLWAGIPLVTRVGQQFSARNSYAFLMNVGVTEGIAWSDEEYIQWGVRLGRDEHLRQQIAWKLRQSRHTSPLWNAKQFTIEMENAYQQMWMAYSRSF
jgi:predicted O-linked N-acetylglucosamine transferase (SPINDLY family)